MSEKNQPVAQDNEAIRHLKEALASGRHWYLALLEAIGLWTQAEEEYQGRHYRYLIGGEAFDWLLLSERLCREVNGLLSQKEVEDLLFLGQPPLKLTPQEFHHLIGNEKYQAFLNYYYGVVVEEALHLAVEEAIGKERRSSLTLSEREDRYQRLYGDAEAALLKQFRVEKGYPQTKSLSLSERREFIYWLFKFRLRRGPPARVASDTRKALAFLEKKGSAYPHPCP